MLSTCQVTKVTCIVSVQVNYQHNCKCNCKFCVIFYVYPIGQVDNVDKSGMTRYSPFWIRAGLQSMKVFVAIGRYFIPMKSKLFFYIGHLILLAFNTIVDHLISSSLKNSKHQCYLLEDISYRLQRDLMTQLISISWITLMQSTSNKKEIFGRRSHHDISNSFVYSY